MMIATLHWLRRFRDDRRGVSAVEFAFIAPILILFYFGMAELCQGFMAKKRTEHIASAVADLVAQTDHVTTAELNDIYGAASQIMAPFPTTNLKQRISSVTKNSSGVTTVDWGSASGWTARASGSSVTVPANLIGNGESVIMAEVQYQYTSAFDYVMPSAMTFTKTFYLRPRVSDKVTKS